MVVETIGGVLVSFALFSFRDLTSIDGVGRSGGDMVADRLRNELIVEQPPETGVLLGKIAKCVPMSVSWNLVAYANTHLLLQ